MKLEQIGQLAVAAPSPLAGEGSAAGRPALTWVRGLLAQNSNWKQPLTRLRFAKPPSPARGEGGCAASGERRKHNT
jgi:hypothetical protein